MALAALTSCAYFEQPGLAEGTIISKSRALPGYGVIESVGVLRNARRGATPSKTSIADDVNGYRLYLRMDAGFQTVDVDNPTFMAGEHVEITKDGRVVRIGGTTINK